MIRAREEIKQREQLKEMEKERMVAEMNILKQRCSFLEGIVEQYEKLIQKAKQVEETCADAATLHNTKMKDLTALEKKKIEVIQSNFLQFLNLVYRF